MTDFMALLHNKTFWEVLGGYYVFGAACSSLPEPGKNQWYLFIYRFLHTLAANADKVAKSVKVPGSEV